MPKRELRQTSLKSPEPNFLRKDMYYVDMNGNNKKWSKNRLYKRRGINSTFHAVL